MLTKLNRLLLHTKKSTQDCQTVQWRTWLHMKLVIEPIFHIWLPPVRHHRNNTGHKFYSLDAFSGLEKGRFAPVFLLGHTVGMGRMMWSTTASDLQQWNGKQTTSTWSNLIFPYTILQSLVSFYIFSYAASVLYTLHYPAIALKVLS